MSGPTSTSTSADDPVWIEASDECTAQADALLLDSADLGEVVLYAPAPRRLRERRHDRLLHVLHLRRAVHGFGRSAHADAGERRESDLSASADAYGYPEPHYAPGWQAPRARIEPLAVWSLVAGILLDRARSPLVLAVLALRRIGRRRTRGRGLAIAGLVLGSVGTVALLVGTRGRVR